MPKVIKVNDINVGWVITFNNYSHLNVLKSGLKPLNIYINPYQLYIDFLQAIEQYKNDLRDPSKNEELLSNFKKGFMTMGKFYIENEIQGKQNYQTGFAYLKNIMKNIF
jgi:hypothetical protein